MNKHIEAMAKDIRTAEMDYLWTMLTANIDDAIDGAAPRNERLATALYEMGYRKSTDVAREIFAEIEDLCEQYKYFCEGTYAPELKDAIAELKKKYESEGADDEP